MNILITGAKGFVGKNLTQNLKLNKNFNIMEYDIDNSLEQLNEYCLKADFVFHLAGVNRTNNPNEFMEGNFGFTSLLLDCLKKHKNKSPILITSSIQVENNSIYGNSKKAGEDLIFNYGKENNSTVYVYRLPNVFGKWCRPNYNGVIATFCHNIARDMDIIINDVNIELRLVYIDDVVKEFINALHTKPTTDNKFCYVPVEYKKTLGEIANLINSFRQMRQNLNVPSNEDEFTKKLYSTYLNYLPEKEFSYPLKMNVDDRGSFTEIIRTKNSGQFSVNVSKKGITKGNHWHNSKNEKFLVVSGNALIAFRKIGTSEIIEYNVSDEKLEVVEIPTGYTHKIVNIGSCDLVTFMWVNEPFDPQNPDTMYEEV